eukprot:2139847-Amphidinium_carterae.1
MNWCDLHALGSKILVNTEVGCVTIDHRLLGSCTLDVDTSGTSVRHSSVLGGDADIASIHQLEQVGWVIESTCATTMCMKCNSV